MSHDPYEKIPFVWEEPATPIEVPPRLTFRTVATETSDILVNAVGRAIVTSLDRGDQKDARTADPTSVAKTLIGGAKDHFDYSLDWWQLAFDEEARPVGIVLPVVYRNCRRDSLEEGTIYYIGVAPEQRGKGYAADLLCKGTSVLQEVGVWRIYCDTDVLNTPMIDTFREVGYKQFGPPQKKPL